MEFKYNDQGERIHDLPWVTLGFDNGDFTIDYADTWVREYRDDPQFNHLEWTNADGVVNAIQLPQESLDKMKVLGFRWSVEIVPSGDVEEWFIALTMAPLLELNDIPEDWKHGTS